MNIVTNAKGKEMVNFIYCKANIFGLVVFVILLMKGGINYEKSVY